MKKKKVIVLTGLILILILMYCIGVYKVNTHFKAAKLKEVEFGQESEIKDGIYMKVKGLTVMDKDELYKKYNYKDGYSGEMAILLVSVTYSNNSNESKSVEVYNNNIETIGYSNGVDSFLYEVVNNSELVFELGENESKDIVLTYTIMDFQFSDKKWKDIKWEKFLLNTTRYPIKTNWMLQYLNE